MALFKRTRANPRPKWVITERMVQAITRGSAAKEIILRTHMPTEWISNFHRESMINSAQATSSMEGSPLGVIDIQRLAIGNETEGPKNFQQMATNSLQFFDTLGTLTGGAARLSTEYLLKMHKLLTEGAYEPPEDCGSLRQKDFGIVDPATGEAIFHTVRYTEVPAFLEDMLNWLQELEDDRVSPMIQASIAHTQLLRLHPFAFANGLIARALIPVVLFSRGFDSQRIFEIDSYFNNGRNAYFAALKAAGGPSPNLTPWLEYCLEGMALSFVDVKERVINLTRQPARAAE